MIIKTDFSTRKKNKIEKKSGAFSKSMSILNEVTERFNVYRIIRKLAPQGLRIGEMLV